MYPERRLVHSKYFVSFHQVNKAVSQTFEYLTLTSMALNLGVHLAALLFSSSSGSSFQDLTHRFIACAQAPSTAFFLSKTLGLLKGRGSVCWYLMPFSSLEHLLNVNANSAFCPWLLRSFDWSGFTYHLFPTAGMLSQLKSSSQRSHLCCS